MYILSCLRFHQGPVHPKGTIQYKCRRQDFAPGREGDDFFDKHKDPQSNIRQSQNQKEQPPDRFGIHALLENELDRQGKCNRYSSSVVFTRLPSWHASYRTTAVAVALGDVRWQRDARRRSRVHGLTCARGASIYPI